MTEPHRTDRRFNRFEPVLGTHADWLNGGTVPDGTSVRVYESSSATAPYIWLATNDGCESQHVHLALADAMTLRDQLTYLIEHHYQLTDAR